LKEYINDAQSDERQMGNISYIQCLIICCNTFIPGKTLRISCCKVKVGRAFRRNAVKCGKYVYFFTCHSQFFQRVNWEYNTVSDTVHICTTIKKKVEMLHIFPNMLA
jgi:hypothetical protein